MPKVRSYTIAAVLFASTALATGFELLYTRAILVKEVKEGVRS